MSATYTPTPVAMTTFQIGENLEVATAEILFEGVKRVADGLLYTSTGLATEVSARAAAITSEASTRAAADTAEASARATADTALSNFVRPTTRLIGTTFRGINNNPKTTSFDVSTALIIPLDSSHVYFRLGGTQFITVSGTSSGLVYWMPIDDAVIDGNTLTSARIRIVPDGGHAGLPAQMPAFALARTSRTGAVTVLKSTSSGWETDASASSGAYNAAHDISMTCDQNNVIDKSAYSYSLFFINEGGASSALDGTLLSLETTMARP